MLSSSYSNAVSMLQNTAWNTHHALPFSPSPKSGLKHMVFSQCSENSG
ncbi:hypothetical protein AmDm5_2638 [Acetobacter malorum]|nr:hypothetical protein AmDm5_2638 [Acetobacter malorum]